MTTVLVLKRAIKELEYAKEFCLFDKLKNHNGRQSYVGTCFSYYFNGLNTVLNTIFF